jgi:hypothetical protein
MVGIDDLLVHATTSLSTVVLGYHYYIRLGIKSVPSGFHHSVAKGRGIVETSGDSLDEMMAKEAYRP